MNRRRLYLLLLVSYSLSCLAGQAVETRQSLFAHAGRLMDSGDYKNASKLIEAGLKRFPNYDQMWIRASYIYLQMEDWQKAEAYARKAILLGKDWGAYCNLSDSLWRQKRYKDALSAARDAVRLDPKQPAAWLDLANAQVSLCDYNSAKDSVARGQKYDPKSEWTEFVFLKAEILDHDGEIEKAASLYENYVNANTFDWWGNTGKANARALYLRAVACDKKVDAEGALRLYKKCLEAENHAVILNPDTAKAEARVTKLQEFFEPTVNSLCNRARVLLKEGEFKQAAASARRALELDPEKTEASVVLVDAQIAAADYEGALESANHGIGVDSSCRKLLYDKAWLLERKGDRKRAGLFYDKCVDQSDKSEESRLAKQGLSRVRAQKK
jgi:tetratricopeptide (TPR) repeat protein